MILKREVWMRFNCIEEFLELVYLKKVKKMSLSCLKPFFFLLLTESPFTFLKKINTGGRFYFHTENTSLLLF